MTVDLDVDREAARARELMARQDWQGARAALNKALIRFPDQWQLWALLGASQHALGERRHAIEALSRSTRLAPDAPAVLNALATVLVEERFDEALDTMDRAVTLAPSDARTLFNRGLVLERMGRHATALADYDGALTSDPQFVPALLNRGAALMAVGRFGEAVANNRQLVVLQPASADAYFNLAEALLGLGCSKDALEACDRALALEPRHSKARIDRGLALADLGRFDDARREFDSAESLSPGSLHAYVSAIAPVDPSVERRLDPRLVFLYRGHDRLLRCDWSMRSLYIERLVELVDSNGNGDSRYIDLPLAYHSLTVPVPLQVPYRIACTIGDRYAAAAGETGIRFQGRVHEGRIRIGYLSADFCEHLNAYLSQPLFRLHDRTRFEVFAYSIGPDDGSEIRRRIRDSADRFTDLRGMSDLDAARRINDDCVDVLVDFGGYTEHCRPGIPAFRPASVQAGYLGFPGTMGAAWMDYRITDRAATPTDQERFWREKLVYLPDTFFIYDRFEPLPDVSLSRTEYGLPEEGFVFCCFNNYYKIEPEIYTAWMEILKAVPSSVLWLAGRNPAAVGNLRREAEARGVGGERLVFAPLESRDRYRARFRLADLFLDTPVFNAMTTACDALAAGLPLLTLAGRAFPSRVAASLLNAVRFPDGITDSLVAYRERAVHWGRNPAELRELKKRLLADPLNTPLFDTEDRVRQLEKVYQEMWRRYQAGLAPESFNVVAQPATAWRSRWH
ncbi:MAG TPA: tetratricopeptide repeat protein [Burkholderiales bacterium]|nr:tetratricopeptide repeat protein [Burkholderiales bacterium]